MTNHPHSSGSLEKRFMRALILNGGLAVVETIGSIITGSSALLADALMNLDDAGALILSIYSERKTKQGPDARRTFGYARMDAFAGFVKGCLLLVTAFIAFFQAVRLLLEPQEIAGGLVILFGSIALVVNLVSALWLKEDACCSLNAKGTYACMVYDAVGSAAVVASGILSLFITTIYVDVAVALLITFFMVKTGWGIFVEGMGYFLQSAPEGFNYDDFEKEVKAVTGVSSVGDIHVWSQSANEHHLTCKVTITIDDACDCDRIITAIEEICRKKFRIQHATIQPVYAQETLQRFCRTHP
jgi:cobalt-zinc-cadmium efflux system protein